MSKKKPKNWNAKDEAAWKIRMGEKLRGDIKLLLGNRKEYACATMLGISQGSLADILNGKSAPSALTLLKLKSIGMDVKRLLEV